MAILNTEIENKGGRLRSIIIKHWAQGGEIEMLLKTGYEIEELVCDLESAIEKLKNTNA